jgi:hypothetical protein
VKSDYYFKILIFFWSKIDNFLLLLFKEGTLHPLQRSRGALHGGIEMLKLILTKSVTVATAATIAAGVAIFMTVAPQAKAPPQAKSGC